MTAVPGDVSNLADLDRLYDTVKKHERKIEIIVANACLARLAPFGTVDEKFFDLHFDANVKGLFFSVPQATELSQVHVADPRGPQLCAQGLLVELRVVS